MTSEATPPDAETQLRDLFNSCVTVVRPIPSLSETGSPSTTVAFTTPPQPLKGGVPGSARGTLTDAGLVQLCGKLQLDCAVGQLKCILQHNRKEPENSEGVVNGVTFKEFLDAFISLLSQQEQRSKSPQGGYSSPIVESMSGRTVTREIETPPQEANIKSRSACFTPSVRVNLMQVMEEQEAEGGPVQGSSSQPPSLGLVGDSEEDYLRNTWRRLGVGHDGFLSLEELASVCHAIGMEKVAHEVIEQLFSRLDVDGDGRISFEEFLHMFQNGGPTPHSSLTLIDSKQQEMRSGPHSRVTSVGQDRLGTASESGIFSSIDHDGTGYASVESLMELWDSLHIGEGATSLLQHLGFSHRPRDRVCLSDLTSALEDECGLTEQDPNRRPTPHNVALMSFSNELKFVRGMLESTRCERDKLRSDLNEANHRLGLLAQELDEHNAHMEADSQLKIQELERQHKEQIRLLQEAVGQERDSVREQVAVLTRDLQKHNAQLQEEDTKLRNQVALLQKDIKRLEGENIELCSRVGEGDRALLMLEKQGAELYHLKHKVAEFESSSPREEEYRTLLERLDRISAENQRLRDCNDEYLAQIEAHKMRHSSSGHSDRDCPDLDGSCMGDYLDSSLGILAPGKRRGSNSCGSGEDSCGEESPRGGKVRRCSKGLTFHYVDVRSCDESFLDTSLSPKGQSTLVSHHSSFNEGSQPPSLEDGASLKVPHAHSGGISSKVFSHVPRGVEKDLDVKRCNSCIQNQSSQDHDESEEQQALDKEVAELCRQHDKQQQIDKGRVEILEHQCQGLEGELGRLKVEVVKVVEEKERLEEERDRLQEKFNEISFKASDAIKLRTLQKRCRALAEKIQSKRLALMGRDDKVENSTTSGKEKRSLETVPEEEEESDDAKEPKADSGNEEESKEDAFGLLEEQVLGLQEDLCQERDFLEKQKAQLEDKLRTLEHSYEMLQVEFDKTEDYWSLKLQEEQEYYEEERKLYDEKFHALERKVHEYDERFAASGGDLDDLNPCKLSTIEESVMWEKQVTDLEEEVTQLRKQVNTLQTEHYNMDALVEERVQEAREIAGQELQQQISNLRNQLVHQQTLNSQLKEQMSKLHQEYEHHVKELQRPEQLDQPTDGTQANDMNQECTSTTEAQPRPGPSTSQVGYCGEETIVTSLRTQLREAQSRLQYLEAALKHHHTHANHILKVSREQHAAEVANLEAMMGATQRMLGQHIAKYKDQLSKASRSDALVRELYLENAQLMRALQVTEGRQKSAEESGRRLGLQQLAHTCT